MQIKGQGMYSSFAVLCDGTAAVSSLEAFSTCMGGIGVSTRTCKLVSNDVCRCSLGMTSGICCG